MRTRTLLSTLVLLAALGASSRAFADSSGWVSGRLMFYQNQGNFCPTTRNCTGSLYNQAQFNTNMGVAHVKVYVRTADDVVRGQGTTDANGNFTVAWYYLPAGAVPQMKVTWHAEHKDGRFTIRNETGGTWNFFTTMFWVSPGSTKTLGNKIWGVPGAPSAVANVYDGAYRTWTNSLAYSGRMVSYFTNVDVRAFDTAGVCPTSCAAGVGKLIRLDPGAAYAPQGRIMHEMGHIASYLSHSGESYTQGADYCWPVTAAVGGSCTWSINTPEWGGAQFEEAFATFLGDRAIYWNNAIAPHTCLSSATACGVGAFNTETSTGATCAGGENRQPLTVMRYLEDVYDTNNDYTNETVAEPFWHFFDTLWFMPNGTANGAEDEPRGGCAPGVTGICDPDGRSGNDYYWRFWSSWGVSTTTMWTNNCTPVGD